MAQEFVKRIAQIFIDDKQAQPSLKSLTAESRKLNAELSRMAPNTKEFAAKAKELQGVQGRIKAIREEIAGTNGVFGQLKAGLGPLGGMMAGALGGTALLSAARAAREEFLLHQQAVDRVTQALLNNGKASGQTVAGLEDMADAMELNSLYSAEDILTQVSTQMLNFGNIAGDNFGRAQQVAVDLATTMNGDLQGATMALGKALSNPADGLSKLERMGVRFTEQQKEQIKAMAQAGDVAGAQATILAELEKRYQGQAEASALNVQGLRELDQLWGNFAEGAGSMVNDLLNDLAGTAAAILGPLSDWLGLTERQSEAMEQQRIEMNALFNVLRGGNTTTEQQAQLVAQLNQEYGAYLPTLLDVNMGEEELARLQKAANEAMLDRIELLAKQELLQEAADRLKDAQKEALQTQLDLERAIQGGATTYEKVKAAALGVYNPTVMFAQANVRARADALEAEKAYAELAGRLRDVADASNEASGAGTAAGVAAPSEEQLAEVRTALNEAYDTMRRDRLSGMEKELEDVDKWRDELLAKAEGSEGDQVLIYQAAQDKRAAIRAKYAQQQAEKAAADLRKLNETLDGIAAEHQRAQLEADEQEVAKVQEKYAKLREQARGHSAQLKRIQEFEGQELELLRAQQALRRQQQEDQVNKGIEAKRLENVQARFTALQNEHALQLQQAEQQGLDTVALMQLQWEQRQPLEEELRQAQRDALTAHYEELYAQADAAEVDTTELQRLHGEAIALLNRQFADEDAKFRAEQDARVLAQMKARRDAELSIANSAVSIFGSLLQLGANNEEEFAQFQKAATLAQIAIDTASAISSMTQKGALTSLSPIDAAVKIAAGVATVLANIARAKQLLSTAAVPAAPTFQVPQTVSVAQGGGQQTPQEFAQGGYTHRYGGWVSTPTLGLIGEAGTEHVSPNWMVTHPRLAPVYDMLEAIRESKRLPAAFAAGGRTTTRGTALVNAAGPGGGDNTALIAVLRQLNNTLSSGIPATITYDQLQDSTDRITTIEAQSRLT